MHDEASEQALLGACLLNSKAIIIASEYVTPADFYFPKNRSIFGAIVAITARDGQVDFVSVAAEIGKSADKNYIFSLPSLCPAAANVREYATAVHEASLTRKVNRIIEDTTKEATGEKLLSLLQEKLYGIDDRIDRSVSMDTVWERLAANINKPLAPGCEYPWQKIQWLTRGLRPGWLCVLAGETSHGKTAAALEITAKAVKDGKRVVLLSLEMDEEAIAIRLAQKLGVNTDHYYEQRMNEYDAGIIHEQVELSHWGNLHLDRVETPGEIGLLFRRWKPDLLIVDHLQLLAGSEDTKELSKTTKLLKLTAERFEKPILCVSQLSRAYGDDRNKLPRLSRLRGSGTIEQDSDTVVFVWRKRDENEILMAESALSVQKSRSGRLGTLRCIFNEERQTFTPVTSSDISFD